MTNKDLGTRIPKCGARCFMDSARAKPRDIEGEGVRDRVEG